MNAFQKGSYQAELRAHSITAPIEKPIKISKLLLIKLSTNNKLNGIENNITSNKKFFNLHLLKLSKIKLNKNTKLTLAKNTSLLIKEEHKTNIPK